MYVSDAQEPSMKMNSVVKQHNGFIQGVSVSANPLVL